MDNTNNSNEDPSSSTMVEANQQESSQNLKRARSGSGEDPPAKRTSRSNSDDLEAPPRGGGSPKGDPPLMPMDLTGPAYQKVEEEPPKPTRLSPPTAPAPAPVVPPRAETRKASSPTADHAKPSTPPFQSKSKNKKGAVEAKSLKGLRHFSMMVCKKVEEKGETTYNEVADELVRTVTEVRKKESPNGKFDEKNIRRRVYDSINVLLAMDIIAKNKKQITWKGLPTTAHHDLQLLEREEEARKKQVQAKRQALQEILLQQICFNNLVQRNKQREVETLHAEKVPLPFIVVNTHRDAIIHCNMAPDLTNVMLEYDRPFEINDDNSILTRLGMHKTTVSAMRDMVPNDLVNYCQEHGLLDSVLGESESKTTTVMASELSNKGQYFRSIE